MIIDTDTWIIVGIAFISPLIPLWEYYLKLPKASRSVQKVKFRRRAFLYPAVILIIALLMGWKDYRNNVAQGKLQSSIDTLGKKSDHAQLSLGNISEELGQAKKILDSLGFKKDPVTNVYNYSYDQRVSPLLEAPKSKPEPRHLTLADKKRLMAIPKDYIVSIRWNKYNAENNMFALEIFAFLEEKQFRIEDMSSYGQITVPGNNKFHLKLDEKVNTAHLQINDLEN